MLADFPKLNLQIEQLGQEHEAHIEKVNESVALVASEVEQQRGMLQLLAPQDAVTQLEEQLSETRKDVDGADAKLRDLVGEVKSSHSTMLGKIRALRELVLGGQLQVGGLDIGPETHSPQGHSHPSTHNGHQSAAGAHHMPSIHHAAPTQHLQGTLAVTSTTPSEAVPPTGQRDISPQHAIAPG